MGLHSSQKKGHWKNGWLGHPSLSVSQKYVTQWASNGANAGLIIS